MEFIMSFNDSEDTSSHRYNEDSSEFSGAPDGDGKEYPGANERDGKSDSKGAVRDSWAKIADELDAAEAPDAGWNVSRPAMRDMNRTADQAADGDAENASPQADGSRTREFYGRRPRTYGETAKLDEDYDARARNRVRTVWNQGDWTADGGDYQDRESGFGSRNYDRRPNEGYARDRSYNGYRGPRPDGFQRDGRDFNRPNNLQTYRQNRYRTDGNDYRQNPGDDYRDGGYGSPRHDNGFRPNRNYQGDPRRQGYSDRGQNRYNDRHAPNDYQQRGGRPGGYRGQGQGEDYRNGTGGYGRGYGRNDYGYNGWRKNEYGGYNNSPDVRRKRPRRESLEPTIGALGKRGEPLSLAEEIAMKRYKKSNLDKFGGAAARDGANLGSTEDRRQGDEERREAVSYGDRTPLEIVELENMSMQELVEEARKQNLETIDGERRRDLVVRVLRARLLKNGLMFGEGTLEILPDEFGFLRSLNASYLSCPDDIYISPSQIRRFGLRNGLTISGQIRPPKERERYFALLRVESINGEDPNVLATKPFFDNLTVAVPTKQIKFIAAESDENQNAEENPESEQEQKSATPANMRAIELIAPIAFGQRALIITPEGVDNRDFYKELINSILDNNPEAYVLTLLLNKRPEDVDEAKRELEKARCEVVGSTVDEAPIRHMQIAEITFEKAKRLVEYGQDVVLFVDSLVHLARAWNTEFASANMMNGEVLDPVSIQHPKKLFGAARAVEGGGSLTVIGVAGVEEGNQFDQMALSEFRSIANGELILDQELIKSNADLSINIPQSFSRDSKNYLEEGEYAKINALRKRLEDLDSAQAAAELAEKIKGADTNRSLLDGFDS